MLIPFAPAMVSFRRCVRLLAEEEPSAARSVEDWLAILGRAGIPAATARDWQRRWRARQHPGFAGSESYAYFILAITLVTFDDTIAEQRKRGLADVPASLSLNEALGWAFACQYPGSPDRDAVPGLIAAWREVTVDGWLYWAAGLTPEEYRATRPAWSRR